MVHNRDKTISHIHTEPQLITQIGCSSSFSVGQLLYLDTDGLYKLAYSSSNEQTSNLQGYVFSFVGNDQFYLKSNIGPVKYRFPLTKEYFNSVGGLIDEFSPNSSLIPGTIGQTLYLSETVPGRLQTNEPLTNTIMVVGYNTQYGFMYKPNLKEPCCPAINGTCVYVYDAIYDCRFNQWNVAITGDCLAGANVFDTEWITDGCTSTRIISLGSSCLENGDCANAPSVLQPLPPASCCSSSSSSSSSILSGSFNYSLLSGGCACNSVSTGSSSPYTIEVTAASGSNCYKVTVSAEFIVDGDPYPLCLTSPLVFQIAGIVKGMTCNDIKGNIDNTVLSPGGVGGTYYYIRTFYVCGSEPFSFNTTNDCVGNTQTIGTWTAELVNSVCP